MKTEYVEWYVYKENKLTKCMFQIKVFWSFNILYLKDCEHDHYVDIKNFTHFKQLRHNNTKYGERNILLELFTIFY